MDGAEQAAARNGSTGQTPADALMQPWGFALIDVHGHGFFKLQDAGFFTALFCSDGAEPLSGLRSVQASCVSTGGPQPERSQSKKQGLRLRALCPTSTLQQSQWEGWGLNWPKHASGRQDKKREVSAKAVICTVFLQEYMPEGAPGK